MNGAISPGSFALGAALLALALGCSAGAAVVVVRRRLEHLTGAPRAVALGTLTIAGMLLVHLVPLILGVLTRGTVAGAAVALLAVSLRVRPTPYSRPNANSGAGLPHSEAERHRPPLLVASWALAGAVATATAIAWLGYVQAHAGDRVTSVDTLAFHLPGVIRYVQTGTLWHVAQFLPGQAQGNYPQYGDLLLLASVLPWHSTALIRYVDPLLLSLAALAVYAIARELRAPAPTAVLTACALFSIRPVLGPGLTDVLTDPAFCAAFAAGTLFLLRHWRTGRRSELVLAGVGFGIALGTKWYGLTDVPAVVAIWLLAALTTRRERRAALRDGAVLVGLIALVGGIWMVRNLILTGNPVFDYRVSLFGATIFPAPPDVLRSQLGFSLAHYFGHAAVLRHYAWPVFRSDFGLTGALLAAGVLTAAAWSAASLVRSRAERIDPRVPMLAVAAVALAIAYTITPYTAQGLDGFPVLIIANTRYGAPALIAAAPLLAWSASRVGILRMGVEAALAVIVVLNVRRYLPVGASHLALAAVLIALAVAAVWIGSRRTRLGIWRLGPAAAVALAVAVFVYHYQRVLAHNPYSPSDPAVAWVLTHDPAGERVALAGAWTAQGLVPVAPLFGPRLENWVDYVGPVIGHRLEQYRQATSFQTALRRGRYQLLVVGTGFPPRPDPQPARWAERIGYTPVVSDPRLVLLRAPSS